MYVDIDWHSIGNLNRELFQDPMHETSPGETFHFWRIIAHHFTGPLRPQRRYRIFS